jgi:hypothetical protein
MQGAAWIDLFHKIPKQLHDNLMLLTSIGTEVAIQGVLHLEPDYAVLRGRVAGTTDAGRIMFIPYDQINYLGFNRLVKEADVYAMLGLEPPPPEPVAAEAVEQPADTAAAPAEPAGEQPKPAEPPVPEKPARSSKLVLLDRLRARLASRNNQN